MPTAFSFGINASTADRVYTDAVTSIIASDRLSIYTGRNTILLGSAVYSEVGNLALDTGNLLFDDYDDSDTSGSFGISVSIDLNNPERNNASGSLAYSDTQAITYATLGAGTINVRAPPNGFNLDALNRDPDHVQEIISETEFAIEIPGVNLKQWRENVAKSVDLIEAIAADIPDSIRLKGKQAIDLYRDAILQGFTREDLAIYVTSPEFEKHLNRRKSHDAAKSSGEKTPAELARIAYLIGSDETLYFDKSDGKLKVETPCAISGEICGVEVSELKNLTETQVSKFIQLSLDALEDKSPNDLEYISSAGLALQCAMYWHIANDGQSGNSGVYFKQIAAMLPDDDPKLAMALGLQPHALAFFKIANDPNGDRAVSFVQGYGPWLDSAEGFAYSLRHPDRYNWMKTTYLAVVSSQNGTLSDYELGLILYTGSHIDRKISDAFNNTLMVVELFAGFASIARSGIRLKRPPDLGSDTAKTKIDWVDENAYMSERARMYDDGAVGSRSNIETQSDMAPSISRTLDGGTTAQVRFDGVEYDVLIDRKLSIVTSPKQKLQAQRQSQALSENDLVGRWEVPTQAQAKRAEKMLGELGIHNIEVKVVPE